LINATSVEAFLQSLQPVFITILVILLLRFILSRILGSLADRGVLTLSTRATIMRFIDVIVFFAIIIVVLQATVQPIEVYVPLSIIVLLTVITFLPELREFTAYINLQLLRRVRGKVFEIHLPNHNEPVYGRITSVELLYSTIEDAFGRKMYVSNTQLMNSVLKEHNPLIRLRITVRNLGEEPVNTLNSILSSLKSFESSVFRIDEKRVWINSIGGEAIVFTLDIHPISTPIRMSDLMVFIDGLNKLLKKNEPVIEVVGVF